MPKVLYILFGALLTVTCCYVLGRTLFDLFKICLYQEEEKLFSFVCGAGLLHLVVFALCSAQLARKGIILAVGLGIVGYGWFSGRFRRPQGAALPPLPPRWKYLFVAIYAAYAFLYLANAMAPEMSPDGSAYHLGFVARYLRDHGFSRITTNMYASLTQGTEMLYLFAFTFGRHSAASLVHCLFTLTLPLIMLTHARRFGFPTAGIGGALLFLLAPVVGVDGTSAYNDVAVTTVVFSVFCLLHIWSVERQPALVVPIGLLAGFCFATKYTAAIAIPFAAVFLLWHLWRARRPWLRPLLLFGACAALMILPWAAKNWIIVDNPMSPFLNRLFPNPNIRISFEQEYVERMRHYGDPKSYWDVPLDLTIHGAMLSGLLGPVFILTPLALLALRWPEGRRLLLAGAFFAIPYFSNIGTRFLLPALPFFSLSLALALARTPGVLPLLVALHAILSWPHVLRHYCSPYAWRLERIPVAAALRLTPEEKYLSDRFYGYMIARMVEDFVPPGERVFTFTGVPEAYTTRPIHTAYMSAFNSNLGEMVWCGIFPDSAPTRHIRFRFPETPLRRIKLVQTKSGGTDQWSVTELRMFRGEHELARNAEWRLRANPNPWDVQMAFDNSPVTRWKTWQSIFPGMFVEVDLGQEFTMDSVLVETSKDQYQTASALYGQRATGDWILLNDKPEDKEIELMRGLRRAAMEELRARGFRYILAAPDDPGFADYQSNRKLWGIHLLAERGGIKLWAIDGAVE